MRKFLNITLAVVFSTALLAVAAGAQNTGAKPAQSTTTAPDAKSQQAAPPASAAIPQLPTQKDQISYAIGMNIGKGLHHESIDVDPNIVLQGMKDALAGGKTLMTDEQVQSTMQQLQGQVREREMAKRQEESETNKKAGEAFLAANKTKPGVVTLPSGLQYKILKEGTGPKPTADDVVVCNYRGTLIDGQEFDSSYKGGEPAKFPVKGVIKGWTEALQLMPVGSKWQIFIPPDLAYGQRGAGSDIGPNETLIFDVELLSIDKKPAEPGSPAK